MHSNVIHLLNILNTRDVWIDRVFYHPLCDCVAIRQGPVEAIR